MPNYSKNTKDMEFYVTKLLIYGILLAPQPLFTVIFFEKHKITEKLNFMRQNGIYGILLVSQLQK